MKQDRDRCIIRLIFVLKSLPAHSPTCAGSSSESSVFRKSRVRSTFGNFTVIEEWHWSSWKKIRPSPGLFKTGEGLSHREAELVVSVLTE